ncbi:MAG: MgtC/SapB family protein [Candidatus Eisenbacteria sp.]|nr:MgtC/SapB family protein [Candidatus Eisenbacteria bacterium]
MELFKDGAVYKLLLALVLGGLVGLEREWHGRAAGLRTHVLVCLGATILLIAARSASETFANDGVINGHLVLDPNRISAGIVTGIGFLGAGAILRMGDLIRGLTTAACIWFVAALGIIIGNGLYVLAVISTLLVLLVLVLFNMIEHTIPPVVYRSLGVTIAAKERDEFEVWCRKRLAANRMRIQETLLRIDSAKGQSEVIFQVRLRGSRRTGTLIEEIGAHPGVRQVRWGQGLERAGGDIRW